MKLIYFLISTVLFVTTLFFSNRILAQDYTYYSTLGETTNPVSTFEFSPDGKMIASSGRTVQLWDAATGQIIRTFTRHAGYSHSVAFSPDGKILASGCEDYPEMGKLINWSPDIHLWDTFTGQRTQKLIGHTSSVRCLSFSPDGTILASGSLDKTIRLWDVATGQHRKILIGHKEGVIGVKFSPNGKTLATVGGKVCLWDVATNQHIRTLTGYTSSPLNVSFSPDGQTLAIACHKDNKVRLWDNVANEYRHSVITKHPFCVWDVCFSPDGQTLATVGLMNSNLYLWDTMSGEHKSTLTSGKGGYRMVRFSPDGRTLAAGKYDAIMILWKLSSLNPQNLIPLYYQIPLQTKSTKKPSAQSCG